MYYLDCIYVTTTQYQALHKIICEASNSIYAHAAVGIEIEGKYRIIEAVAPAIRISPGTCYDDCQIKQVIRIPITAEQRLVVIERIFELVGKAYGVDDVLTGGAEDVFGDAVASLVDDLIGSDQTYDCSATQTESIRSIFPDFAQEIIVSAKITPEHARKLVLAYFQKNVTGGISIMINPNDIHENVKVTVITPELLKELKNGKEENENEQQSVG